ncbi:MAG: YkgJ family cysteine cluster protein [Candidatus Altiarchaeota archaeon]
MRDGWLRRRYMWYFRRKEVLDARERRAGECVRCGKCCSLCLFHNKKGSSCRIYRFRPAICRNFPLTAEDLERVSTCGYTFKKGQKKGKP